MDRKTNSESITLFIIQIDDDEDDYIFLELFMEHQQNFYYTNISILSFPLIIIYIVTQKGQRLIEIAVNYQQHLNSLYEAKS